MENYVVIYQWIDRDYEEQDKFDELECVRKFIEDNSEYLEYWDVFDWNDDLVLDIDGYEEK